MTQLSRRSLITGLVSFAITAPAIVRAASLMPVKVMKPTLSLVGVPIEFDAAFEYSGLYTLIPMYIANPDWLKDYEALEIKFANGGRA